MSLPSQSALNNNPNNQNQNNNDYPPLPSFIDEPPSKPTYKGFSEKPHPNTALRSTNPQNPPQMPNPPVQGGPMLPAQGAPYPPAQGAPYPPGQGVPPPQGAPYPPPQGAPYPPAQGGHMPPPPNGQIPPHGAVPVAQPVYVPPPIPGTIPVYPAGYPVPYGVYPGYPYPYPMQPTAVVLPPGYTRDYSAGFSPFGDLADDINNLF